MIAFFGITVSRETLGKIGMAMTVDTKVLEAAKSLCESGATDFDPAATSARWTRDAQELAEIIQEWLQDKYPI